MLIIKEFYVESEKNEIKTKIMQAMFAFITFKLKLPSHEAFFVNKNLDRSKFSACHLGHS